MTSYLDLADFIETAAEVLDLPMETVSKAARLDLAESALHAPQAGWGEVEFYPALPMKAAVLLVRLAKNHALPDGNKRTALTCMVRFCLRNGYEYVPPAGDDPDGEESMPTVGSVPGDPDGVAVSTTDQSTIALQLQSGDTTDLTPEAAAEQLAGLLMTAVRRLGG